MDSLLHTLSQNMFHLPVPVIEKIIRPVLVYLSLIVFLRLFGKRELAQLNPFDLVVLLSLSNTVQNAIIGDDNSITGGVLGAFSLLGINWLLTRLLFRAPRLTAALEGTPTTLIRAGKVDQKALETQSLTMEELVSMLNKNGYNDPGEVDLCVLEPNGTFYVKGLRPTSEEAHTSAVLKAIDELSAEVRSLRAQMEARG